MEKTNLVQPWMAGKVVNRARIRKCGVRFGFGRERNKLVCRAKKNQGYLQAKEGMDEARMDARSTVVQYPQRREEEGGEGQIPAKGELASCSPSPAVSLGK